MSHHRGIIDADGKKVGHLRITNAGDVLSIWVDYRNTTRLFIPSRGLIQLGDEGE